MSNLEFFSCFAVSFELTVVFYIIFSSKLPKFKTQFLFAGLTFGFLWLIPFIFLIILFSSFSGMMIRLVLVIISIIPMIYLVFRTIRYKKANNMLPDKFFRVITINLVLIVLLGIFTFATYSVEVSSYENVLVDRYAVHNRDGTLRHDERGNIKYKDVWDRQLTMQTVNMSNYITLLIPIAANGTVIYGLKKLREKKNSDK